jgi:hypothetical protein
MLAWATHQGQQSTTPLVVKQRIKPIGWNCSNTPTSRILDGTHNGRSITENTCWCTRAQQRRSWRLDKGNNDLWLSNIITWTWLTSHYRHLSRRWSGNITKEPRKPPRKNKKKYTAHKVSLVEKSYNLL